jgi:hypothetical protein
MQDYYAGRETETVLPDTPNVADTPNVVKIGMVVHIRRSLMSVLCEGVAGYVFSFKLIPQDNGEVLYAELVVRNSALFAPFAKFVECCRVWYVIREDGEVNVLDVVE